MSDAPSPGGHVGERGALSEGYLRFATISIALSSLRAAGSSPYISFLKVLSSIQVTTDLMVDCPPVMGSEKELVEVHFLPPSSQVPVEFMMPVPMLSTHELTNCLVML